MIKVATLASEAEREPLLAASLNDRTDVDLVLRCVDRIEALAAIRSGRVDAIIGAGRPDWFDRQCRDEAAVARVRLVFLEEGVFSTEGWGTSLPVGSSVDEVVAAVRDASPPEPDLHPGVGQGRFVSVWGPKGAPGRSRIAIELACELAEVVPTLLVDADPYGGDIVQLLGVLDEVPTVIWASKMAAKGELDQVALETNLKRIGSIGPCVLPGLPHGELWAEISTFGWRELLKAAGRTFGEVVLDVGFCLEPTTDLVAAEAGRNHMARQAIASSDRVIAVCRADPVGIKNFLWGFSELRLLKDDDDILVVVNRVLRGVERETADLIRQHLGKRVTVFVPDSPGDVEEASRRGLAVRELVPDSGIREAIRSLAVALGLRMKPRGFLTRLAGKSY